MPELPEVETVRRGLAPLLEGRRLVRIEVRRPDLRVPFPADLAARLTGARIRRLGRRAKYLRLDFANDAVMLLHLGMAGRIRVYGPGADRPPPGPHDHLVFETDEGTRLVLTDPRRFGMVLLTDRERVDGHPALARLGPEPLGADFTAGYLRGALASRRTALKAALLDQRLVAGLGNIYVCEALYRAGLSPRRGTGSVGPARAIRLVRAVQGVLEDAIAAGGSSLRDYSGVAGELGTFQTRFDVYGRTGATCRAAGCAGVIARIRQSGRSSFYCPRCQH